MAKGFDSAVKGKSYAELYYTYEQMKAAGYNSGNDRGAAKVLKAIQSKPEHRIVGNLIQSLIEIDRQLDSISEPLALTEEEIQAFWDRAISEIEPWYQEKVAEIEKSEAEGRVRTAEDTLDLIRDTEAEVSELLAKYDLTQAETEEEFIDKMAALTAQTGETLEAKRIQWTQRLENVKLGQIQKGIFSSGIGKEKRAQEERLKELELGGIERRAQEEQTALEREKKYSLENIQLARQAAEQDRIRRIGTPEQTEAMREDARNVLGLGEGQTLGSDLEIARARTERGINPLYGNEATLALRNLEEQRGERVLSRRQEYITGEEAIREKAYEAQRKKILAQQAEKARSLQTFGINYG